MAMRTMLRSGPPPRSGTMTSAVASSSPGRCQLPAVRACRSAPMFCFFLPLDRRGARPMEIARRRRRGREPRSALTAPSLLSLGSTTRRSVVRGNGQLTTACQLGRAQVLTAERGGCRCERSRQGGPSARSSPLLAAGRAAWPHRASGPDQGGRRGHRPAAGTGQALRRGPTAPWSGRAGAPAGRARPQGMATGGPRRPKRPLEPQDYPPSPPAQPTGPDFGLQPRSSARAGHPGPLCWPQGRERSRDTAGTRGSAISTTS